MPKTTTGDIISSPQPKRVDFFRRYHPAGGGGDAARQRDQRRPEFILQLTRRWLASRPDYNAGTKGRHASQAFQPDVTFGVSHGSARIQPATGSGLRFSLATDGFASCKTMDGNSLGSFAKRLTPAAVT